MWITDGSSASDFDDNKENKIPMFFSSSSQPPHKAPTDATDYSTVEPSSSHNSALGPQSSWEVWTTMLSDMWCYAQFLHSLHTNYVLSLQVLFIYKVIIKSFNSVVLLLVPKQHILKICPYFFLLHCFPPFRHIDGLNLISLYSSSTQIMKSEADFQEISLLLIIADWEGKPKLSKWTLNWLHAPFSQLLIWDNFTVK